MTDRVGAEAASDPAGSPFVGDSEMAARMRAFDWSSSLLGPADRWPQSLRTAVSICLSSRYPMVIWWGPDLVLLYNDAWIPILGPRKHPRALGHPGSEVWPEMWHIIGEQLNSVLATGEATWSRDQLLPAMRFGYLEEAYFTYSYSAIHDETGAVGGAFTAVTETTQRVISERRSGTLRSLGEATARAAMQSGATMETVCTAALRSLADERADLPFAAVFSVSADRSAVAILEATGLADPSVLSELQPQVLNAVATGDAMRMIAVDEVCRDQVLPGAGPVGDLPPLSAVVIPVQRADDGGAAAVLLAGLTPYREVDDEFRAFLELVGTQISRAVGDALSYQAQRRRAEALAELDKAKSEFFANVSHEFRTPLTLIAGPAHDLLDNGESLDPAERQRVEVIARNAGRLRRLVDDLLDFATIEAGRKPPEKEYVDLTAATRELVASFAPAIAHAGLELRRDIAPLPHPVLVDVSMWEKIVLNLLSNALKYTLAGYIAVDLHQHGEVVRLAVTDSGIGIPSADQPKVFERFHRVRGQSGRSHEGAGIGRALVSELVRLHEGTIDVQSQEGVGSTFTVELPCAPVPGPVQVASIGLRDTHRAYLDEALQWPTQAALTGSSDDDVEHGPPSSPTASVPVVEDNADMRAFVAGVLSAYFRVLEAPDGQVGLELARRHHPDLILTDVMMPNLDGFGLLACLRADPQTATIPVVMLSARAGEEAAVGGLKAGADDYLAKPFSTVELLARVRSNLEMAGFRNREADFRRSLIDAMQEGFFIMDEEGAVVEANRAFFELVGYEAAGLPYHWPHPWLPKPDTEPDAWAMCQEAFEQIMGGGGRFTVPLSPPQRPSVVGQLLFGGCERPTHAPTAIRRDRCRRDRRATRRSTRRTAVAVRRPACWDPHQQRIAGCRNRAAGESARRASGRRRPVGPRRGLAHRGGLAEGRHQP